MSIAQAREPATGFPASLIHSGVLSADALRAAIAAARERQQTLVPYLVQSGLADADEVAAAVALGLGIRRADLHEQDYDLVLGRQLGRNWLQRHAVVPMAGDGPLVRVAIADPSQLAALDEVQFHCGRIAEPVIVAHDRLSRVRETLLHAMAAFVPDPPLRADAGETASADAIELDDGPIVHLVQEILQQAAHRHASDIHFEPYAQMVRIRLRVDGVLQESGRAAAADAARVAARLKVLAKLDIAERRVPQDGRLEFRAASGRVCDFRVSTCPTLFGEKIVLRLLDAAQARLGMDALGCDARQQELFSTALAKPYGLILVTGPTGSGKTVSLYTGLQTLNTPQRNLCTAEDPVEIDIPGINQVSIRPQVGLTFATALRAFLRQDPDVIMVGEIRDLETAEIALKAAQTGHLVLSTLHTKDAPGALTRLLDMGVKPYAVAASLTLVVAQRLARCLCTHCRRPIAIPAHALRRQGFRPDQLQTDLTLYDAVGCARCTGGYQGRIGIFQVLPIGPAIGRLILDGCDPQAIAARAAEEGVADLRTSALRKVLQGVTSLQEIDRVTTD